jgi:hypothetical protein
LTAINTIVTKLEKIKVDRDKIVLDIVKQFETFILDEQRKQMYSVANADGTPIEPEYKPLTISIKNSVGQPTDRVTLKDTGAFYGSFFIVYGPKYFAIYAKDGKTRKLISKYGTEIFGLNDVAMSKLLVKIKSDLKTKIQSYL